MAPQFSATRAIPKRWSKRSSRTPNTSVGRAMDNDLVKRLIWSALLAGLGALASIATQRVAVVIWQRVYGEDPPE